MPPRSAYNEKLVKKIKRQNAVTQAKESGNKFTQKQSHFELRQEESQIKQMMEVGGRGGGEKGGGSSFLFGSEAPTSLGTSAGARPARPTSTRSGVFGLSGRSSSSASTTTAVPTASRSTRRTQRFQLEEHTPLAGEDVGLGGGLLGALRRPRNENEYDEDPTEGEAPPRKMTKQERFKEVIHNSRSQRVASQRERDDREEQTKGLDEEFSTLRHLLPTRDKDAEERKAFLQSNTPEVRAMMREHRKKNPTAKVLILRSSEPPKVIPNGPPPSPAETEEKTGKGKKKIVLLDSSEQELLNQVRGGVAISEEERELAVEEGEVEEDDFDKLMNTMRVDPRRAHATERLLSEEEILLKEAEQAVLEADRRELPSLHLREHDMVQRTKGEWVSRGGDDVFDMDGDQEYDDNVDIPSSYEGESDGEEVLEEEEEGEISGTLWEERDTDVTAPPEALKKTDLMENLLEQLEKIAETDIEETDLASKKRRSADIHKLILQLYVYGQTHLLEVGNTFRAVLCEAEKQFLRGNRKALRRPLMLYLYVISKLFPVSDYRHEVVTPFFIFLCSTVMQMKLDTLENAHCSLVLSSMLAQALMDGEGRFAAEAIVGPFNILALQLPRSVLEPARYQGLRVPFPLMERGEKALLSSPSPTEGSSASASSASIEILSPCDPHTLLLAAYRLLAKLAETYSSIAAFPALFQEPFKALDALLQANKEWKPSSEVRKAHEALASLIEKTTTTVIDFRTPLAMRSFRPRPLRQFEPLLMERPESAVRNEIKHLKKTVREDKKRVIRHLTAEATVQRRAREKETAASDELREKRYRQVMGQLQSQQHLMNTVDSIMDKARSKKKKSISGLPSESSGGGD